MKIKVFKFEVSNASSSPFEDDFRAKWFQDKKNRVVTPEQIEKTINDFCYNKSIINININNVDIQYHNNGRGNTVELWYTIMYNEN